MNAHNGPWSHSLYTTAADAGGVSLPPAPPPADAGPPPADPRDRRERLRSGPPGVQFPWFLPYFDDRQTLSENAAMREAYRRMPSDPNVKAALYGKVGAIQGLDLKLVPSDRKDQGAAELAELVRWNLTQSFRGGFPALVWNVLVHAFIDGYSICEKVWRRHEQGRFSGAYFLRDLKPKDAGADCVPVTDEFRNVVAVRAMRYNAGEEFSPADFVIFRHNPLFDAPTGQSDLRGVYSRYWLLDTTLKLRASGLERRTLPVIVGHYLNAQDRPSLEEALALVKSQNWLAIPEGARVEALNLAGAADSIFASAIQQLSEDVCLGIAGATLQARQGDINNGRGSSAEHRNTADIFIRSPAKALEATLNDPVDGLIKEICDLNQPGVQEYPQAVLQAVDDKDMQALIETRKAFWEMGGQQSRQDLYETLGIQPPDPDDAEDILGSKADQEAQVAAATLAAPGGPAGVAASDSNLIDATGTRHQQQPGQGQPPGQPGQAQPPAAPAQQGPEVTGPVEGQQPAEMGEDEPQPPQTGEAPPPAARPVGKAPSASQLRTPAQPRVQKPVEPPPHHDDERYSILGAMAGGDHEAGAAYADWLEERGLPRQAVSVRGELEAMRGRLQSGQAIDPNEGWRYPIFRDRPNVSARARHLLRDQIRRSRTLSDLGFQDLEDHGGAGTPVKQGLLNALAGGHVPELSVADPEAVHFGKALTAMGHRVRWIDPDQPPEEMVESGERNFGKAQTDEHAANLQAQAGGEAAHRQTVEGTPEPEPVAGNHPDAPARSPARSPAPGAKALLHPDLHAMLHQIMEDGADFENEPDRGVMHALADWYEERGNEAAAAHVRSHALSSGRGASENYAHVQKPWQDERDRLTEEILQPKHLQDHWSPFDHLQHEVHRGGRRIVLDADDPRESRLASYLHYHRMPFTWLGQPPEEMGERDRYETTYDTGRGGAGAFGEYEEFADAGRWVTIGGAKGESGGRHGGSPVFIQGGRITKGAPSLVGRDPGDLKGEAQPQSHRKDLSQGKDYERAVWARKARGAGIDPADLDGLAGEMKAHDREHVEGRKQLLKRARTLLAHYGYDARALTTNLRSGRVEDEIPHLDVVADSLARTHPEQFAGHEGDPAERLKDLLAEGNPQPMSSEDAYEQAWEHLESLGGRHQGGDDEVPFAESAAPPLRGSRPLLPDGLHALLHAASFDAPGSDAPHPRHAEALADWYAANGVPDWCARHGGPRRGARKMAEDDRAGNGRPTPDNGGQPRQEPAAVSRQPKQPRRKYPIAPRDEWYGHADYESTGGRLTHMAPDDFLARARPLVVDDVARDNIDDLKRHVLEGGTLDPLMLSGNDHDGRHRAHVAKELGIGRVPVLTWDDMAESGERNFAKEQTNNQAGNYQRQADNEAAARRAQQPQEADPVEEQPQSPGPWPSRPAADPFASPHARALLAAVEEHRASYGALSRDLYRAGSTLPEDAAAQHAADHGTDEEYEAAQRAADLAAERHQRRAQELLSSARDEERLTVRQLADVLEDHGDPRAAGLQALARSDHRPEATRVPADPEAGRPRAEGYSWVRLDGDAGAAGPSGKYLPGEIFDLLESGQLVRWGDPTRVYASYPEALLAAAAAFAKAGGAPHAGAREMAEPGERNFGKAQTANQAGNYQRQADNEAAARRAQQPQEADPVGQPTTTQETPPGQEYHASDPLHQHVHAANLSDPLERNMLADALEDAGRSSEADMLRQGERLHAGGGRLWPSTRSRHADDVTSAVDGGDGRRYESRKQVVTDYGDVAPGYGERRPWGELSPDERAAWSDWLESVHEQTSRIAELGLTQEEQGYFDDNTNVDWEDVPNAYRDAVETIEAERHLAEEDGDQ